MNHADSPAAFPTIKTQIEQRKPESNGWKQDPQMMAITYSDGGLTKREYAAIRAMQALLAAREYQPTPFEEDVQRISDQAVVFADALMSRLKA